MVSKYEGNGYLLVGAIIGSLITWSIMTHNVTMKKYHMNLKCIQGELYEEIKPNIYAKSHLECFEQTRL
jgi:hypothetical protein